MFADLLIIAVCVGIALFGAWETANIRHEHDVNHKRRRTDHSGNQDESTRDVLGKGEIA